MNDNDSRNDGENSDDRARSKSDEPSTAEKAVMAISVAFTVLLFGYVIWQAAVTPSTGSPEANVVGVSTMEDGSVRVNVELINERDLGLITATVEVDCASPPPEIAFQNVPADSRSTGYVTCPPGTSNPSASVSAWIEA